ncbi:MAG: bifunctional UDP-N-acetylglucosamine pyrophosphorylase / glucosamine-phosphate N-acetyltransferase, partial [Nocardioidaceae bacterium]|nr:bifunctional UDP-N-acetylglucosamine pyrophosphorylase / glucosamine-phosphate N-acetyltransferase [Nocardioidaceae bacterium]
MSDRVTAIVLAAGAGTRMKSARAKVLHQIAGRSMLEHALVAVAGAGVHTTVAVVGHDRVQVSEAIAAYDPAIVQAVQEQQNGTGHAVHVALESLDSPPDGTVIVTYADVPLLSAQTLSELLVAHRAAGHTVTILTAEVDDPTGYGRILRGDDGAVAAIREHKDASDDELSVREINSGILVVDGEFLTAAVASLET